MKMCITWILVALLALCGTALAEMDTLPGNICSGGIAATGAEDELYFSLNGLQRMDVDGALETLVEGEVRYLQCVDGMLYFVSSETVGDDEFAEEYLDTLCAVDADGNITEIGAPLRRGMDYAFSNDYNYSLYDTFNGYQDMTVYGGHIYYIGNSGVGGEYETIAQGWGGVDGESRYTTSYTSGASLFRMDLDGGNVTELISGLGNGQAHMAICNGRIAVASCFQNSVYAYDFSNFMLYDLEGNLLETKVNGTPNYHSSLYKEDQEFTVIINAIQTDGENIYASLGDSEGDFASSRFVNVENIDATLAYEAWYTPSLLTDDGLIYMGSDVQDVFWDDALDTTVRLIYRDNAGEERVLAYLPSAYLEFGMQLNLTGEKVYLRTGDRLLRIDLVSGDVDEFNGSEFAVCPACDPAYAGGAQLNLIPLVPDEETNAQEPVEAEPTEVPVEVEPTEAPVEEEADAESEYLLPDSDKRLYSKEELKQYDKETLALMRNEILARHGYPFQKEKYQTYFGEKSWYTIDPDFDYNSLNSIEMANVETIKGLEG